LISSIKERGETENSAYQLFSACGFKSIEILNKELRSQKLSDKQIENIKNVIESIIGNYIDLRDYSGSSLSNINYTYDDSPSIGQEMINLYFKRLQNRPEIIYTILALSHEITSHSFPVAYSYLKEYVIRKYGAFDILRYMHEEWKDMFLPESLFTLTIFDKLEENFADTQYSPRELAELILADEKIHNLVQKPALFSKIISNIMGFKNIGLKDAFIDGIVKLGSKNFEFKVLINLILEFKLIPQEDRFSSLTIDLPIYNPAWHGPQKDWLKDGVISAGLYWSTAKQGERNQYDQFPEIFINGSKIDRFYSKFGGYIDKSEDTYYKDKLVKNGAEKVLVKEFSGTGRKIEIYLYSNLDAIKSSHHSITISRGHAGEQGNSDYPGLPGTLRLASHCRSINDSDPLIRANPDSPIITITGTGRGVETNPVLYYLLQYLGSEETWGNWQDVKGSIKPHIPGSILKYNFPTDDISFIYAAILQKLKQQKIQKESSLNILGIMGVLKSIKLFGNNL